MGVDIMNADFMKKAIQCAPQIIQRDIPASCFGIPVEDDSNWFGYRFEKINTPQSVKHGDEIYIDFGNHYVGHVRFEVLPTEQYPDAPIQIHIKFAENLYELESDSDAYEGELSPAWLQQEIIYIEEPSIVILPRRYAFRYIKVTVVDTRVPIQFKDFTVTTETSADAGMCESINCEPQLMEIDKIGCRTLQNCMQKVFEDGPKRDRRLWLGDLRLQALTNYYTFRNIDIVKECMYLFAAYTEPGGRVPRDIFVSSRGTHCNNGWLEDYSLMFAVSLCDYYEYTKDHELVDELFSIADDQLRIAWETAENGIVKELEGWWAHIDWCDNLQKVTSVQGILLYTLDKMIWMCRETGREKKVNEYSEQAQYLRKMARDKLYDSEARFFVNQYDKFQLSVHSQVWMVLGNVVQGDEAKDLMQRILQAEKAKDVVSPYMHHYTVEALLHAGMKDTALDYIKEYWGKMVELGADTYWEVFVPGDFTVSPYRNPVMNSCCHAWSCSASYFIRKYFNNKIL